MFEGSNQRIPEYRSWVALCLGLGCKTYVEIGVGSSWEQHNAGMKVVTVDLLPNGMAGIPHIQGDSQDLATLYSVLNHLGTQPHAVFIDGDHSTEAVRKDFDIWYSAATMVVGFHDILMDTVQPFWNEIKRQHPSVEIIGRDAGSANTWQHGSNSNGDLNVGGIGVLLKIRKSSTSQEPPEQTIRQM